MNKEAVVQFIRSNIGRHKLCSVATIDGTGKPWVVCVAFTLDEQFNIIWRSLKDTEHSKHIQAHPDVALGIFSDTEDVGNFGLYMKAKAREVTDDEELKHLIAIRSTHKGKPLPDVSELLGDALGFTMLKLPKLGSMTTAIPKNQLI